MHPQPAVVLQYLIHSSVVQWYLISRSQRTNNTMIVHEITIPNKKIATC